MRILYLTEWSPFQESGVLKKLIAQVQAWRELGADAQLLSICTLSGATPACSYEQFGKIVGTFHQDHLKRFPFARLGYWNKIVSAHQAAAVLQAAAPDLVYYRQHGPYYPGLGGLLERKPTIIEINTRAEVESKLWGRAVDFMETRTREFVHRHAAGFVCMTDEIAVPFRRRGVPVAVIPNAINALQSEPLPPTKNRNPKLVIVATPLATSACWNGVDKLFALARRLSAFEFHVVGYSAAHFAEQAPANLVFHGYLDSEGLSAVYAQSDVGLGTLAAHRKKLEQACSLKTREYLSYGLPVIVGYQEAEAGLRGKPYILEIPNRESNLLDSVDEIQRFAEQWLKRRVTDDLSFMSRQAKERERLAFFEQILQDSKAA